MLHPKDIDWMNGYKNKTLLLSTRDPFQTYGLKVRGWKMYYTQTETKVVVAILISDKRL